MKIVIIQGDHYINSRTRLNEIKSRVKKKNWEIRVINLTSKINVSEQLTASSLFNEKVLFIIEDPQKLRKNDLDWLKDKGKRIPGTLVIYHNGYLPKTFINKLPKIDKSEDYKLQKLIWKFLDSFYPGSSKKVIQLFHQTVKNEPPEFIFSLLIGRVKNLYWTLIDEKALGYPTWRMDKLKYQANKFSKDKLKKIINEFSKIDIKVKTSKENLVDALDLLIISQLE